MVQKVGQIDDVEISSSTYTHSVRGGSSHSPYLPDSSLCSTSALLIHFLLAQQLTLWVTDLKVQALALPSCYQWGFEQGT